MLRLDRILFGSVSGLRLGAASVVARGASVAGLPPTDLSSTSAPGFVVLLAHAVKRQINNTPTTFFISFPYSTILPLGAKLGDSSNCESVSNCTWRVARSCIATLYLSPLRWINVKLLPSGL